MTRSISISFRGPLAQLVEHLTFNQGVPGSNPGRPTSRVFLGHA